MSVIKQSRLLERPEETIAKIDDYVLIDSETDGTRKVLVKNLKNHATPNYQWLYNPSKTIAVRIKLSDGSYRIYFNDFLFEYGSVQNSLPSFVEPYAKPLQERGARGHFRSTSQGSTYDYSQYQGYVYLNKTYFDNPTTAGWSNGARYISGYAKCIFESTDPKGVNEHPWEEPTFDPFNG